jgi:phenylpropionate dioxygenase-like ring-hydroxylating dioxygenase large terminal subunit
MGVMKKYPIPPYPNGWFRVAFSDELPRGGVKAVKYFGRELVIFRGDDQEARVLDAYCPHLGAHLGKGGKVIGNSIKCPFHGWRYDGCGNCIEVPFANKIPANARVGSWPVIERNGVIFAYYHAEGCAPDFEIPTLPEFRSGQYSCGRTGRLIRTHIQETQENMIDVGHFNFIHHGFKEFPRITEWEENGRHFRVALSSITSLGPLSTPSTVTFDVHGVGCQVVHVDATIRFVIVFVITPIDEESIDFRFMVLYKKTRLRIGSWLMRQAMLKRVMMEIGEDIPVWENKTFHERPALSELDRNLIRFRKWNYQFYTVPLVRPEERRGAAL